MLRFYAAYVILALVLPQDDMNDVVEPVMQGFAGVLFMVLVLLLAVFGYRLWTLSRQKSVPVAAFRGKHGSSLLFGVTFAIVLIYLLRSAYDFVTTSGVGLVTLNGVRELCCRLLQACKFIRLS